MIRSILLPLSEGRSAGSAVDCAYWLAEKYGSHLCALALIDVQSFEIPVLGTPDGFIPSVVTPPIAGGQNLLEEMTALARERLEAIAGECTSRGIACSTNVATGVPAEVAAREAIAHDMIVMARSGYGRAPGGETHLDPLVSQVIRGSIRPVLVAGPVFRVNETFHLLVAFDGSGHAGRALAIAAELSARPGVICTLTTVASSEEAGLETLAPAEAYLYHHGVVPLKQVLIGTRPWEKICDLITSARADLLIMGAYGHGPMREMLFGCTTERILSHCPSAVILQS